MRIIKLLASGSCLLLAAAARVDGAEPSYPPNLAGGKKLATGTSDAFLKAPSGLRNGVEIAKTAPTVDFMYFPGQTYPGNPWSNWGECLAAGGKCYASIGDHHALPSKDPRYSGNDFVFEYDPKTKALRNKSVVA